MSENISAPAGVDFSSLAEAIIGKTTADVTRLHEIAKSYKARNGSLPAIQEWINGSEDADIIARREKIAAAEAKIKEMKKALEDEARTALVDPDDNPEDQAKEFKTLRTATRTLLMQSKGTLESFGQDVSAIEEMLENLPNITGGVSASGRSPEEMEAIRAWARENGHEVKDRGRISKDVLTAYDAKDAS